MAITEPSEEVGPADDEIITVKFSGRYVKDFLALLNMNTIRNFRGERIVFGLRQYGDEWVLTDHRLD